jgi:hypothetical protein
MGLERPQSQQVISSFHLQFYLACDFVLHHGPAAESVVRPTAIDATMEKADHMILFRKESFQALLGDNAKIRTVHESLLA